MARAIDCKTCLHEKVCALWWDHDRQDASCFCKDGCDYFTPALSPPNEWVSVEERLPRLRENVLVCAYWHEHWGVYIGWNNGHGWTVSCGIGQRNDVQVSHWMLLPAPPDRRPPEGEDGSK